MYYNITHKPPDFDPKIYGPQAQEVIRGLLSLDVGKRLGSKGMQEIHATAFFNSIDLVKLEQKALQPPFVPTGDDKSTNYVSSSLAKQDVKRDSAVQPGAKVTLEMQKKMDTVFENFSYVEGEEEYS